MISIIIPIYNVEKYIRDCLVSIQKQTYVNFEAICIVDGSPDNSESICREFEAIDDRFKVYVQENQGVCAARNLGLSQAKGEYVCFVDADDMVDTDYLKSLTSLHQPSTLPIISYSSNLNELGIGNSKKEYKSPDYIRHIFREDVKHPNLWAMLFERDVIEENKIRFFIGCIKNEDTEFFVKYMANIDSVVVSAYKGYYYRVNPNSVMNSGLSMKSLTSIEAQKRMADYLVEKRIYPEGKSILSNAVQVYVYSAARSKNKDIYDYLHKHYPVREHMKKMLPHPRIGRKFVSLLYLLLGEKMFYKITTLLP